MNAKPILLSNYPSTGSSAEAKAARQLARNKARIEKAKYGTPSHATLERRRRRKARPTL